MANIKLIPLQADDRKQFILDNQEAFNYGALEEFGRRDDHFEDGEKGDLEILFVTPRAHSRGIGFSAWCEIEKMYPGVKVWETMTPYFETRNIHFYVNRCGFPIVEFFNQHHPDPNDSDAAAEADEQFPDGMFRFQKKLY